MICSDCLERIVRVPFQAIVEDLRGYLEVGVRVEKIQSVLDSVAVPCVVDLRNPNIDTCVGISEENCLEALFCFASIFPVKGAACVTERPRIWTDMLLAAGGNCGLNAGDCVQQKRVDIRFFAHPLVHGSLEGKSLCCGRF